MEIVDIDLKVVHMPLQAIGQLPARQALPAQIEDSHGKSALAQFADGLKVLFDEFDAARNDDNCSPPGCVSRQRRPQRVAQANIARFIARVSCTTGICRAVPPTSRF